MGEGATIYWKEHVMYAVMDEERTTLPEESTGFLDLERLGRRLRAARTDAGYKTTSQVANILKLRGVKIAEVSIGRYERGEGEPRVGLLIALSLIYKVPFSYFAEPTLSPENLRDWRHLNG